MAGAAGLGYFLYRFYSTQVNLLNQYEVHLQSVSITSLTTEVVTMDVVMLFTNKSKISATITNIYGDIALNGVKVGSFNQTQAFQIAAQDQAPIPITISFSPAQVLSNVVNFVLTAAKTQDLPVLVTGYVNVKSGFLTVGVPFTYNTTVKNYLAG